VTDQSYRPPTEAETKAFIDYMNARCKLHFCIGATLGLSASLILLALVAP
jgi:hypothetical protein